MPHYEVTLWIEAMAPLDAIEADNAEEAVAIARETWRYSDLQNGEVVSSTVDTVVE